MARRRYLAESTAVASRARVAATLLQAACRGWLARMHIERSSLFMTVKLKSISEQLASCDALISQIDEHRSAAPDLLKFEVEEQEEAVGSGAEGCETEEAEGAEGAGEAERHSEEAESGVGGRR
eukprot:3808510-Pleurochrysis_carterae.AAC.1